MGPHVSHHNHGDMAELPHQKLEVFRQIWIIRIRRADAQQNCRRLVVDLIALQPIAEATNPGLRNPHSPGRVP